MDNTARMANRRTLEEELGPIMRTRSKAEWLERLEQAGVPAGPILNVAEMHEEPQAHARGMVTEVSHTKARSQKTLGMPVKFSETPAGPRRGAPLLGEHSREVLMEHGFSTAEIDLMLKNGGVVDAR